MERPDIIINRLKDFHNEVSNSGKIDKQSILSLEEFIGENLITSKININKVSETPRVMMAEQANQIVEEKIKELETEYAPPTVGDVISALQDAYHDLLPRMIGKLKYFIGSESIIAVAMTSEGIKFRYIDNVLTDLTTLPIDVLFGGYKDYIREVSSIIHGEDKSEEYLIKASEIDPSNLTPISIIHNVYLNILEANLEMTDYEGKLGELTKITPKPITVGDIVKIISNVNYLVAFLDKLYHEVDVLLDAQDAGSLNPNEPRIRALYEVFKFIKNSGKSHELVSFVVNAMVAPLQHTPVGPYGE